MMELRQLQYFEAVCRSGNFTRAAASLYVAQPAITNAIHRLEAELGVQLLHRNNKAVNLTPEGQIFLERVHSLLDLVGQITQEMSDLNDLKRSSISLGVPPQIGAFMFPDIFLKFGSYFPNLQLNVIEEGSKSTIALLEKGEIDIGLVILPDTTPNLNTLVIRQEPILLCVSPEHHLCGQSSVNFSELRDEKFIMRKAGSFNREIVLSECQKHGFSPTIVLSSGQIQTIKSLVSKNIGIAFFMKTFLEIDSSVTSITLEEPIFVTLGLAWKKGKYISKASQAFIDFVITHIKV